MKITFIRPSMAGEQSSDALKPIAFSILNGLTPPDFDVQFFDEHIETLPSTIESDAICFSVDTFSAKRAYALAEGFRQKNNHVQIIMGGFHPSACPDEAEQYADSVVVGDAEPVWEQVMADLQNGMLQRRYTSSNSTMLPFVRMNPTVFNGKNYARIGVVQWKRGCVGHCDFCSIFSFYQSRVTERDIDDVIAEIRSMREKIFFIADDNLLHDKTKLKEFLEKLVPLKKKWACQISINVASDNELVKLMARSGCVMMIIGFESLNADNLRKIGKKPTDYAAAISKIYAQGIMIYGTFIFGYPEDTLGSFDQIYEFAMRWKFAITNFNPLMAMPGTALYDELMTQGKLIDKRWWLSADFNYGDAMHRPENFTAAELAENCKRLRYRFYSVSGTLRRYFSVVNLRHMPLFLLLNLVSALEIHKKQRRTLGGEMR